MKFRLKSAVQCHQWRQANDYQSAPGTGNTGLLLNFIILTLPAQRNLTALTERSKPFTEQYNFTPGNPLPLFEILTHMFNEWPKGGVLALGIKPIGVSDVSEGSAFESELKDVQKLGNWFEASPEVVLSLEPDLIIQQKIDTATGADGESISFEVSVPPMTEWPI